MGGTAERRRSADGSTSAHDVRRHGKVSRDQVRALEVVHEVFARRFSGGLGEVLGAVVALEPLAVEQMSFDDYVRSMPNPTVVCAIAVPPLPGAITIELDIPLALLLVDRLLSGRPVAPATAPRRLTELETYVLCDLVEHGIVALGESLGQAIEVAPELTAMEFNPQFVQVAPPSDTVLLLSYRVTVTHDGSAEGMISLCYPSRALGPLLERVLASAPRADDGAPTAGHEAQPPLQERLFDLMVGLTVRLRDCPVPAPVLAALRVGDVVRLDHRVDEPALVEVGGVEVLNAHIGRRGARLAFQVVRWRSGVADRGDFPERSSP